MASSTFYYPDQTVEGLITYFSFKNFFNTFNTKMQSSSCFIFELYFCTKAFLYPLAGFFEYLFMFWLHRHLPAKQVLNSKQSAKGYERKIREILRRSGYFGQMRCFKPRWALNMDSEEVKFKLDSKNQHL